MDKFTVAFDCDGTLRDDYGNPNQNVILLYKAFQRLGAILFIWSGGGIPHANEIKRELGLTGLVIEKGSMKVDLTIDDHTVLYGKANMRVS